MSPRERSAMNKSLQRSADRDPMLHAYGRYYLPWLKRITEAEESQANSLATIARILSANGKTGDDEK